LKVISGRSLLDRKQLRRFQLEAKAVGRLHHTNIVAVYGIGHQDGLHYFVMQYIDGRTLDSVLENLKTTQCQTPKSNGKKSASLESAAPKPGAGDPALPATASATPVAPSSDHTAPLTEFCAPGLFEPRQSALDPKHSGVDPGLRGTGFSYCQSVARIGLQVAGALDYAAAQGVLHRDIKPANLLLDRMGQVWVTDFGLAKLTDTDDLTHSGEVIGTLHYMAPERFQGRADARSDVYSLGLTLYELLTFRPAYDETDRSKLIARILAAELPDPRRLNPRVPRDLETIVLKAIYREASRRYASAGEMAEDLRRFLADRPIKARCTSLAEKGWRWCRRNPAVAGLTVTILLLLAALTGGALIRNVELSNALRAEREKRWESLRERAAALRLSKRPGQRVESLRSIAQALQLPTPPGHSRAELRTEAAAALALPDIELVSEWPGGLSPGNTSVKCAGNLKQYALLAVDGTVTVRRVGDGKVLAQWKEPTTGDWPPHEYNLRLNRDGRFLAIWHSATKRLVVRRLGGPEPAVWCRREDVIDGQAIDISADGAHLAYVMADTRIALVDLASDATRYLPATGARQWELAFSPEGKRLAVSVERGGNYAVEVRDVVTGQVQASLAHRSRPNSCSAWHPNGNILAITYSDRQIRIWDVGSVKILRTLEGNMHSGIRCAFDSSGQKLVSNDWSGRLRLWETSSGREMLSFLAEGYNILGVSDDDRLVVQRNDDQTKLQLLRLHSSNDYRTVRGDRAWGITTALVHPEGRLLAIGVSDGIALVDISTGWELERLPITANLPLLWEASGELWTYGSRGLLRWPLHKSDQETEHYTIGPPEQLLPGGRAEGWSASSDGRTIAVPERTGALVYHRGEIPKAIHLQPQQDVRHCAVSPDGRWVATGSHQDTSGFAARVWDAATGRLIRALPVPQLCPVAFSRDGRWLLTSGGGCKLWRSGTWAEGPSIGGATGGFSPDSLQLAVEDAPGVVRLVKTETGAEIVRLETTEQSRFWSQTFSADGTILIAADDDRSALHIWDLRALRLELAGMGLDWDAPPYAPGASASASSEPSRRGSIVKPLTLTVEGPAGR
jgi:serine/threonine protein kinase/WD40 repeat protein